MTTHILSALLQAIAARQPPPSTTLNLDVGANVTLSNSNRTYTSSSATTACSARSTTSKSSSKVYFEVTVNTFGNSSFIGFGTSAFSDASSPGVPGWYTNSYAWREGYGIFYNAGQVDSPVGSTWATNDVLAFAIDLTAQELWVNDLTQGLGWNDGSGNPGAGTGGYSISGVSGALNVIVANYNNTGKYTFNFGASAFSGTMPSGFGSWNAGS